MSEEQAYIQYDHTLQPCTVDKIGLFLAQYQDILLFLFSCHDSFRTVMSTIFPEIVSVCLKNFRLQNNHNSILCLSLTQYSSISFIHSSTSSSVAI